MSLGRKLTEHSQALLEAGIRYSTRRTESARTIFLECVAEDRINDGNDGMCLSHEAPIIAVTVVIGTNFIRV